MHVIRFVIAIGLTPLLAAAQSRSEYATRRAEFAGRLADGVVVVFGAHEPPQDYLSFYQAPAFSYLTGFREPDAALLMIRRNGTVAAATMFVRPRQPSSEVWTGPRVGVEGIQGLTGIRGRSTAELPHVLDSLAAARLPFWVVGDFAPGESASGSRVAARSDDEQLVDRLRTRHPDLKVVPVNDTLARMRGTKSASELTMIRNAVDITVRAQREAIPAIRPGLNEFEIQALIEYTFRRNGADRPAFATIVGSGPNSTTLHYNANDRFIGNNDMVVLDIGASFRGYAADVTRTVPASGVFSPPQRAIYQLVRDAQAAAERQARVEAPARLMSDSAESVLANGLARLGLIESPGATYDCSPAPNPRQCSQFRLYYMHGLGHGIGLEVHDPDQSYYTGRLRPGSIFTIEPGVYVRERLLEEIPDTPRNRELAARLRGAVATYRNIGVRIEDDYAVTATGVERLSLAPREITELEALMKAGSAGPAPRDELRVEKYRLVP